MKIWCSPGRHTRKEEVHGISTFRLPVNVQADKVEATFDKGVLKITLPKTEGAKKKEIEVKVK